MTRDTPLQPLRRTVLFLSAAVGWIALACVQDVNVGSIGGDGFLDANVADGFLAVSDAQLPDGGTSDANPNAETDARDASGSDAWGPDAGCGVNILQLGTFQNLKVVTGAPPPQGVGGTIVPGTYVLASVSSYIQSGTAEVRETIVIKGSPSVGTMDRISEIQNVSGSFQAHAPLGEHFTWTTAGPNVFFGNLACPAGGQNRWGSGGYSATATSISLYGQAFENVYVKVP